MAVELNVVYMYIYICMYMYLPIYMLASKHCISLETLTKLSCNDKNHLTRAGLAYLSQNYVFIPTLNTHFTLSKVLLFGNSQFHQYILGFLRRYWGNPVASKAPWKEYISVYRMIPRKFVIQYYWNKHYKTCVYLISYNSYRDYHDDEIAWKPFSSHFPYKEEIMHTLDVTLAVNLDK